MGKGGVLARLWLKGLIDPPDGFDFTLWAVGRQENLKQEI